MYNIKFWSKSEARRANIDCVSSWARFQSWSPGTLLIWARVYPVCKPGSATEMCG